MSKTPSVQVYFVQTIDTICIVVCIMYWFSVSMIYIISVQCNGIHPYWQILEPEYLKNVLTQLFKCQSSSWQLFAIDLKTNVRLILGYIEI